MIFFRKPVATFRDHASAPGRRLAAAALRRRLGVVGGGRAASTAIYYLLARGERSRWHRVDAAEGWHWYAGAPLALDIVEGRDANTVRLGPDLRAGERPQAVVPARAWQQAASLGDWTLTGCTVAPGFAFASFELAPNGWSPVLGAG